MKMKVHVAHFYIDLLDSCLDFWFEHPIVVVQGTRLFEQTLMYNIENFCTIC